MSEEREIYYKKVGRRYKPLATKIVDAMFEAAKEIESHD